MKVYGDPGRRWDRENPVRGFNPGDKLGIIQPRTDALFDIALSHVCGDHHRKLVDIAIIDNLKQLFLRPFCGVLRAEVIQNQQASPANIFEIVLRRLSRCCYRQSAMNLTGLVR